MTIKQTINLRPSGQEPMFGDQKSRERWHRERAAGRQYDIRPTLPAAREAYEHAKRQLEAAERQYGPTEKAYEQGSPRIYETIGEPGAGVHGRRVLPYARKHLELLRDARAAHAEAETTYNQVRSATEEALARQTCRYAVAPLRRLSTSPVSALLQGQEVRPDVFVRDEDFRRKVREGSILEKPNFDKRHLVAPGKTVVTKHGTRTEGEPVWLEDLEGADVAPAKRLQRLLKQGMLVKLEDSPLKGKG